jgi:hypothetical protein
MTTSMAKKFATPDRRAPRDIEQIIQSANSGRIYFEQLHLHPVRLGLTFSQEWIERNPAVESMMMFQFIRGMVRRKNSLCMTGMLLFLLPVFSGLDRRCTAYIYFIYGWSRI